MLEPVRHGLGVRLFNAAGAALERLGIPAIPVDPVGIVDRARRRTGLSDFGGDDYREGLEVLCRSATEDAQLSTLGRLAVRGHAVTSLATRLQMVDLARRDPERTGTPLVPPLIVVGVPRSGTTLLHRLLALGSDARALAFWEVRKPLPPVRGRDRRKEGMAAMLRMIKRAAPALDLKHHVEADEPEECMYLLDGTMKSLSFWTFAPVYSYLAWFLEQDLHEAYRAYARHLRVFQAQTPERRLTLKAPAHTSFPDALLEAVPEAMLVQTHRDPVPVVSSLNSLFYTVHSVVSRSVDVHRLGRANVEVIARSLERNQRARSRIPDGRLLDVRYPDLVADPLGTVRRIHDHFGLQLAPDHEARIRAWLADRPQHGLGKHEYSAEEFGLTDAELASTFADYRDTWGLGDTPRPQPADQVLEPT